MTGVPRRWPLFPAICAIGLLLASATARAAVDEEAGRRIYWRGASASGDPARIPVDSGEAAAGFHPACVTCHRASGLGSVEAGILVPPVTGTLLFQPSPSSRIQFFGALFHQVQPGDFQTRIRARSRPAYTEQSLARALREGRDPNGRALAPWMPRYSLSDGDMASLLAYLRSLSATPSPGVNASTISFATIVAGPVNSEKRDAMLDVLRAWLRWKNSDTRRELASPRHSPFYQDEFRVTRREWTLAEWVLEGPPASWAAQLDAHYRAQPVFAVLSGVGDGDWLPVHDFCERVELPCIFPNTDLPPEPGHWSVYFNQGLTVQARAIARVIQDKVVPRLAPPILQLYRQGDPRGTVPASAFRRALGADAAGLRDRVLEPGDVLDRKFWTQLLRSRINTLVIWLDEPDLSAIAEAAETNVLPQIIVPSSLVFEPAYVPEGLRASTWLLWPFALPGPTAPSAFRVKAWLRSRGVRNRYERIQLNTWFAVSMVDDVLGKVEENFFREYLLESIEEEVGNSTNPGVFPRLSLGPGQRFASKGCYVVRSARKTGAPLQVAGDWIVP